jgi:serine/threonine-protein kinase
MCHGICDNETIVMLKCPECSASLDESDHTCSACGTPLEGTAAPTVVEGFKAVPGNSEATVEIRLRDRSRSRDGGVQRLLPGDVLAGRYRLVSFLGRGGMGEIYQVEDLKLGQTVALKFLPEPVARKGTALARFHQEVRLARQVSHPNVCRVFDVGEAHGRPFLCMEFIRGNDLRFLLREGRLPLAKALNIGWQLCAGLSAIHDAGILHRDLKPSNVMIDERGRARITDFGVAALAEESRHEWSGTPAYMSPEQAVNGEMSIRSDLYSLGLVLYELFASEEEPRPADPKLERHGPMPLSNLVVDLDPTAERMILRCLEKDPRNRPPSAAEVARAFSVDPLAAALASSVIPSPEMVASIQEVGDLSPAKGATWLAAVLLSLLTLLLLSDRFMAHRQISLPHSPQVLAGRAHSLLAQLGYKETLPYTAYGFETGTSGQPLYWFWYRESPRRLQPDWDVMTAPEDPPRIVPGEAYVELDMQGHLRRLQILPEVKVTRDYLPPDWTVLLWAAGFDPAQLKSVRPGLAPLPYAEQRAAWEASLSGNPPSLMRIEAASFGGRPVSLNIDKIRTASSTTAITAVWLRSIPGLISLACLLGAIAMARRHLRLGIGDLNGAWRLASILFFITVIQWPFSGWIPTWENLLLVMGYSALAWCSYLSIEPLLRRSWPAKIVSWTRLLAGHVRNPMVGRDILAGCVLGLAACTVSVVPALIASSLGQPPLFHGADLDSLLGVSGMIRQLCWALSQALTGSLGFVFLVIVSHLILRRERWALGAVAAVSLGLILSGNSYNLWLALLAGLVKVGLLFVIWLRFGLLADLASRVVYMLVLSYPLTRDPSDWYAGTTLFVLLAVSGMAVYGFVVSTAPTRAQGGRQ